MKSFPPECHVNRSRSVFPLLALLLVTLLAWPWNLALSAAESAQLPANADQGAWVGRGARSSQIGRTGRWCQIQSLALAPDFDEDDTEERSNAVPNSTAVLAALGASLRQCDFTASGSIMDAAFLLPSVPITFLCRMRC